MSEWNWRDWNWRDYIGAAEGEVSPWWWLDAVYWTAADRAVASGWGARDGEADGQFRVIVCGLELQAGAYSRAVAGNAVSPDAFYERTLDLRLVFSPMSLPVIDWGEGHARVILVNEGRDLMDLGQARRELFRDAFTNLLAAPKFRPTADAWRERLELAAAVPPAAAPSGPRRI